MNSYKQALYSTIIRIAANVVMVCAVFFSMYQASRWPGWPSEAVFCIIFFGITVPVWIFAIYLTKLVRRTFPAEHQSLIFLPGRGQQLVSWRVAPGNSCKYSLARQAQ